MTVATSRPLRLPTTDYGPRTTDYGLRTSKGSVCLPSHESDLDSPHGLTPGQSQSQHWRFSMKIVVIGGTGLIGSKVVARLNEHGHEAIAASPTSGVNTLTGEGLARGADRRAGRGRRCQLSVLRGRARVGLLHHRHGQRAQRSGVRRRLPSRRTVRRGHRPAARQRLLPRQERTGTADQGSGHPVLDRARHPVLRVRRAHRRFGDRRRHGADLVCAEPTDGGRRRRNRCRPHRGRSARRRHPRSRRPRPVCP